MPVGEYDPWTQCPYCGMRQPCVCREPEDERDDWPDSDLDAPEPPDLEMPYDD